MNRFLHTTGIVLLLFTGLNATVAGLLFMIDPSGGILGMTPEYIQYTPFTSYLIPGVILLVVNGIFNLGAGMYVWKNKPKHERWIQIQGIALCGWIGIQVLLVNDLNVLHITMMSIGLLLILCGWILKQMNYKQSGKSNNR